MATNRKRVPRRHRSSQLTREQRHYLLTGREYFSEELFADNAEATRAWNENKEELIRYWQQDPEKWDKASNIGLGTPEPGGPGELPWAATQKMLWPKQ